MMRVVFGALPLGIVALLGTTHLALAGEVSVTGFAGPMALSLPIGGGVLSAPGSDENDWLTGGQVGFSASAPIGAYGNYDLTLGARGFIWQGSTSSSQSKTLDRVGNLIVQSGTGPNSATIDQSTVRDENGVDGSAHMAILWPDGGHASGSIAFAITSADGPNGSGGSAAGPDTFFDQAIIYDGTQGTATLYAIVADRNGAVYMASGDLDGLQVDATSSKTAIYTGADLPFGMSGRQSDGVVVAAYAGPSYRYLKQSDESSVHISGADADGVPFIPAIDMASTGEIEASYLGAMGGLSVTAPLAANATLTLTGGIAAYDARASVTGSSSFGALFDDDPDITLSYPTGAQAFDDSALAIALSVGATYNFTLDNQLEVSLGGTADFLSRVPTASGDLQASSGDGTTGVSYESGGDDGSHINWANMLSLGVTAGIGKQF